MDELFNTYRKGLPSCPNCLGETFEAVNVTRHGLRYTTEVQCQQCNAVWRIKEDEHDARRFEITLLDAGENPRQLDVLPLNTPADQYFWEHVRENRRCEHCGGLVFRTQRLKLRTGGVSGGLMAILGTFLQYFENTMAVDVLICSQCRRIDFFDAEDDGFMDSLQRTLGLQASLQHREDRRLTRQP
jgi:hypothetical protein